jgi:sugar lactone lactonase YvrE
MMSRTTPRIECVLPGEDLLGECVLWCTRSKLVWWVDSLKATLQSWNPITKEHRRYAVAAKTIGSFALRDKGGMLLALDNRLATFDPGTGVLEDFAAPEADTPVNHMNDGRCDRRGRFWVGSMPNVVKEATGSVYRAGGDGRVERMFGDVLVPNSMAFSPDDRTFYFADTRRGTIWAFDLNIEEGSITNKRVFADTSANPGGPDGSCVDAEGYLWNAVYGGGRLVRYAPTGRIAQTVELPIAMPTCCAFGGPRLDTLYVSTARYVAQAQRALTPGELAGQPFAGGLLAIDVGVRGLPGPTSAADCPPQRQSRPSTIRRSRFAPSPSAASAAW